MRSTTLVLLAGAVLLGACASDSGWRAPSGPLYSLRTLDAGPAEVAVTAAALPLAAQPAGPPPVGDPGVLVQQVASNGVRVYVIEVRIVRQGQTPEVLSAPRLTVFPNQRANISIVNQLSFVQDFDAEIADEMLIADPIVGILQDGLTLDLVTAPVAGTDRAVDVAFKLLVADLERPIRERKVRLAADAIEVTIQLPRVALNSVTGVRRLGAGKEVLVATLPDSGHGGAVDVHMRMVPTVLPAGEGVFGSDPETGDFIGLDLSETMTGGDRDDDGTDLKSILAASKIGNHASGRLALEAVTVLAELELGVAVSEETLRDRAPQQVDISSLRVYTTPVPGAEAFALLQESYLADYEVLVGKTAGAMADPIIDTLRSGITGTVLEDGNVRIEWATTPTIADMDLDVLDGLTTTIDVPERHTHTVTVPLRQGRQLVPIARMPNGRTAAVWLSFTPE